MWIARTLYLVEHLYHGLQNMDTRRLSSFLLRLEAESVSRPSQNLFVAALVPSTQREQKKTWDIEVVICILIGGVALESRWDRRVYIIPASSHYQGVDCPIMTRVTCFANGDAEIGDDASIGELW
ncbi:hypothetical protein BDW69DRAFT_178770 [Aspergillus filifer]